MNTKYLLLTVATVALVSACSDDEFQGTSTKVVGNDHIVASLGNDTRTQLSTDDNAAVLWTTGDAISVFTSSTSTTDASTTTTTYAQVTNGYTLDGDGGASTGTFTGVLSGEVTKVAALYPYNSDASIAASESDYKISTTLKSELSFDATQSNLLNGAPMVALFTAGSNDVTFQNPGAIVDITVKNVTTDYDYIILKSVGDGTPKLNGAVEITTGTTPTMTVASTNDAGKAYTKISWTTANATQDIRAIFPVPTGTYNLEAYLGKSGSDNTTSEKLVLALGSKNIEANTRYGRTVILDQVTGSFAKAAKNAAEATSVLKDEKDGLVSAVVVEAIAANDASKTITLPANQTTETATPVSLTLNSVEATDVVVKSATDNATDNAMAAAKALTIAAAGASSAVITSLDLDVPTTTVTLNPIGENGKVTYGTVTVNTDLDSLIIGNGVTVNNLVIKSGNVIVKAGGTIASATLDKDVTSGAIYYNAATSPVTSYDASKITVAPEDLLNILQGGTVKLSQDISVPKMITVTKALTLDLNGHNIKVTDKSDRNCLYFYGGSYGLKSNKPVFEIKNTGTADEEHGVISGSQNGIKVESAKLTIGSGIIVQEVQTTHSDKKANSNAAILIDTEGELTLNGTTVKDEVHSAVSIYPDNNYYAALTVGNGTQISGKYTGIIGNGKCKAANSTLITINGGTITCGTDAEETGKAAKNTAIYLPQNGKTVINGGTITGANTGIEIRAGELEIKGGTIQETESAAIDFTANGNGTTAAGAAIAVSQHTYNATNSVATKVTISGDNTQIIAPTGAYAIYQGNVSGDNSYGITLDIKGGAYTGKIYSENVTDFIMGGTFSDMASAVPYATGTANTAASIKLSADQTVTSLSSLFSDRKNLIVDLGTKKITVNATVTDHLAPKAISGETSIDNFGSLEFRNGTIEYAGRYTGNWALFIDEGQLTLDGITFNAKEWNTAIGAQKDFVKLVAKNSVISGLYFSIASNASNGGVTYGKNAKMEFTNTKFISDETGFMNNVEATISFNGCTFQGNHQGALLRVGTFSFSGANTIFLKPTLSTTHSECKNSTTWGTGNAAAFAPLVIGNRHAESVTTSSYPYATSVTFGTGTDDATTVKMATIGADTTSYATSFPGVYVAANSASGQGVTISGLSHLYKDSSVAPTDGKDIVYYIPTSGTSNITVDNATVDSNTSATLSTKSN